MAFLYAGEEFGNDKTPDLFETDTINRESGYDISGYIKKLYEIKKNPIFSDALYEVSADKDTFVIKYRKADSVAIGIFNIKGEATDVKADLTDGRYINIINGQSVDVRDGIIDSEIIKRNDGVIEIIK